MRRGLAPGTSIALPQDQIRRGDDDEAERLRALRSAVRRDLPPRDPERPRAAGGGRYPAASQPRREHDLCPDPLGRRAGRPRKAVDPAGPFPRKLNPEMAAGAGPAAPGAPHTRNTPRYTHA